MNKAEKAVEQAKLDREKAVVKELEEHYEYALKSISERLQVLQAAPETQSNVYRIGYQKVMRQQVSAILENLRANTYTTLDQYMHDAYTTGYVGAMYSLHNQDVPLLIPINQDAVLKAVQHDTKLKEPLYASLGIDTAQMKKGINRELSRGLASGLTYDEIARNIKQTTKAPLARAKTIARTEGHRIHEQSSQDAAIAAKAEGADIVKQWDATLDGDTRPNHRQLDGQIRELEEPFEVGSFKPMHPGGFGIAKEDCNCRCVSLHRARWALDEDELAELKKRAETFGLDKSDEFADFEKKYLQASEEGKETAPVIQPVQPATQPEPQQQPEPPMVEPPQPVQTSEPDQQTEPAFGKPAARSGKIDDVLSPEMAAAYDARMQDAPENVRNVHDKYRDRIVFADAESKDHPHYALAEGGITIDLQRDLARDNGYALYHEIGHNVDNNMHIDKTFTGSGKWGGDTQYGYSYTYGKNKFGKAIASDADKALEDYRLGIVKQHEDAEKEAKRTYDGSKTRSFLEMMGLSGDELETEMELDYRDHVRKTKTAAGIFGDPPSNRKDIEYGFARHISDTLSRSARGDISDMFESTFQYVDHPFGSGHGLDYWKQEEFLRPTEAFAEMYGASIASPESWEQIKRFFPNAVKVFEEMLE